MIALVDVGIYLNCILIASGIDENEFEELYLDNQEKFTPEECKGIIKDISDNKCNGFTCELECGNIFVFIRKGNERRDLVVSHELFHAANKLLCRAGVNFDSDAEPWAYLIGWLTNEYYVRLEDYEKGNK